MNPLASVAVTVRLLPEEKNVTRLCRCGGGVGPLQMFATCHGSGGEQLQGPEISVLVGEFFLAVGVNREVDGGEGDVTQEAGFGSLMEGIKEGNKEGGG